MDSVKVASGCQDCGCEGPAEVLTFDHVRGTKKFNVGQSWNQGRVALEEEMAKCEIVCANCHAKRTKSRQKYDIEFVPFPKIPRFSRDICITEKLDGTNGVVWVDGEGDVWAGSRNRWISPEDDNYGFAAWVEAHKDEFSALGPNIFRGEWWGAGIQRRYGLTEKRFSLFDVKRWGVGSDENPPVCCSIVPVLYVGPLDQEKIEEQILLLQGQGSVAAPGFMDPEGICIYHSASGQIFKKTCKDDDKAKGQQ